jgi:hypothetical protein
MAKWVRDAICNHQVASGFNIDPYLIHFSIPPSFTTFKYSKMKAYENHFLVDNDHNNLLVTYNCGVAGIFQQSQGNEDEVLGVIQYVGTLKEVLQLNYGPISSPIILFWCRWVKNGIDSRRNPTYRRDDVGFILANF